MKNKFQNWSDIRVFLSVVRQGSTLAASRKLGIAQPTVARRIEVLEHEIGLKLFEHDTRGFKPTKHANTLFSFAEAVEATAREFADKARELARPQPIRITASGYFSDQTMSIISDFTTVHPEIEIEFVHNIKFLDLFEGDADIAFRVSASEPDTRLICRKIGSIHYAIFGAKPYADQYGLPQSLRDLRNHSFVTFKHDDVPDFLHNWLTRHVTQDQIIRSFSDIDQMYAAIRSGHGLGLMHVSWADTEGALVRCSDDIEELSTPINMLMTPEVHQRPEVKVFAKFFAPRYAATFK